MSYVFDEGLALFAGLIVTPKRAFLTECSCRIDPRAYPDFMAGWFDAVTRQWQASVRCRAIGIDGRTHVR